MFRPRETPKRNGFTAGHWTDPVAKTGCTVVVFNRAAPAIVDVRGGAPGTRETDLLGSGMLVQSVDAIVLAGGSAFGLAATDGVMAELRILGRGVATPGGSVPIVPAAVIFDLSEGAAVSPTAENGAEAFLNRGSIASLRRGLAGVGMGATTGKMFAPSASTRGGFGHGFVRLDRNHGVHALVAVNSAGIIVNPENGRAVIDPAGPIDRDNLLRQMIPLHERAATTLAVVVVDAPCDRRALERCGVAAHDGFARAIWPCHTLFDGDVVFAAALEVGAPSAAETVRMGLATELAVERAIFDAVTAN